ncbi:MAG: NADPH:quinone reductase [Bythopirellula sp.]|nr:NADPH:quinone reductase [Bythopirellula sp.]
MKAVWYEALGPADKVLQYGEMPVPQPLAGEVRIAVHVSGVNPIDVKKRLGGRGGMTSARVVPHFDGAGVIDAVGEGVDAQRVGERVWFYEAQWQRAFGAAAEFVTLPAHLAVPLPESVDFEVGACLGIPALTAYGAVFADGAVSGQTILVTGGAGAVGRYAVQFAKLAGARVIATVSNDEKAKLAKSAGADEALNYKTTNIAERVLELTDGQGVDRVVEVEFGGNLATNLPAVRIGGTIATYASQAVPEPKLPFYDLMYRNIVIRTLVVFQLPAALKAQATCEITGWLNAGQLTHEIGERFSLEETAKAHQAVESGVMGKVLVFNRE